MIQDSDVNLISAPKRGYELRHLSGLVCLRMNVGKGAFMLIFECKERKQAVIAALLSVWESSVRATHLFLSEQEIARIKKYVPQALRGALFWLGQARGTNCFPSPLAFFSAI